MGVWAYGCAGVVTHTPIRPYTHAAFDASPNLCYNHPMVRTLTSSGGFAPAFALLALAGGALALLPAATAGAQVPSVPQFGPPGPAGATLAAAGPRLVSTAVLPTSIGFRFWQGLVVLRAYVGDGQPTDAVLDTGLPLCIVNPDFAAKRSLGTEGVRDMNILDRSVKIAGAKPQGLRLEAASLTGVSFGVFNVMEYLSSRPVPDAPPVWLGNSALTGLVVTVDPRTQKVTIEQPGYKPPSGATVVPFEMKDGRPWLTVKANGKKAFSALLDTGAVGTLLPASIVKDLKLKPAASFTMKHPNGKEGKVGAVQLDNVTMGGLKVPDVQALYVEEPVKDGLDPDLGIIGNDVLMRYRLTLDFATSRLIFEKLTDNDKSKSEARNTGGLQPGQNGYRPGGYVQPGGSAMPPMADPSRRRIGP